VGRVIIGVDPHKLSATIEVLNEGERVLGGGRFGTDRNGYRQMLTIGRRWPYRVWAVEGCDGIGRHLAQRLVADGETVLDVPAKLSARAREFSTPDTAARPTPPTPNPSPWSPSALRTWARSASTTRWSPCEPEAGTGSLARSPDHPQGRTPGIGAEPQVFVAGKRFHREVQAAFGRPHRAKGVGCHRANSYSARRRPGARRPPLVGAGGSEEAGGRRDQVHALARRICRTLTPPSVAAPTAGRRLSGSSLGGGWRHGRLRLRCAAVSGSTDRGDRHGA